MTRTLAVALGTLLLAFAGCHRPDPNSVEDQVALVKKGKTARERERALENLRRLGRKEAVPGLVAALAEASPKLRGQIATVLGEFQDRSAVKPLADSLDFSAGGSAEINAANKEIARALGDLGGPDAVRPLVQLLKGTQDNFVRIEVISALGRLKDRSAVDLLSQMASDDSLDVLINKKAILALSDINDPSALPVYLRMLFFDRGNKTTFYPESSFAIFKLGAAANDRVLSLLKGEDKELMDWAQAQKVVTAAIFAKAAQIESDLQDRRAIPALLGLLRFEDSVLEHKLEVRRFAAEALGRMRVSEAASVLSSTLGEEDSSSRSVYMRTLVQIGDASVMPKFVGCARKGSFDAREFCMLGVVLLGNKADAREFDGLVKAEPVLFDRECKELGGETDCAQEKERTVAARVKIIESYKKVLETAGGCTESKCLEAMLSDADPVARERAAYALGRRLAAESLPALFAAIKRGVKDAVDLNPRFAAVCAVDWITAASADGRKRAAPEAAGLRALVKSDEKHPLTQRIAEEVLRLAYKLERFGKS